MVWQGICQRIAVFLPKQNETKPRDLNALDQLLGFVAQLMKASNYSRKLICELLDIMFSAIGIRYFISPCPSRSDNNNNNDMSPFGS